MVSAGRFVSISVAALLIAACSGGGSSVSPVGTATNDSGSSATVATQTPAEPPVTATMATPAVTEPFVPSGSMCPPSPSGRIAYELTRLGAGATGGDVYTVEVVLPDGIGDSLLSAGVGAQQPSWSPDGTRVVVSASSDGADALFIVRCDGTIEKVLSDLSTGTPSDPETIEMPSNPSWSPDGTSIAFASPDGLFIVDPTDPQFDQPVTTDFYGGAAPRSIFVTEIELDITVAVGRPGWSPDGTQLVFGATDNSGNTDVYVVGVDGSDLTRLTTDAADDYQPAWSPDGTQIAFRSSRDDKLWLMHVDGTLQQPLFSGEGADPAFQPAWSPDGTQLVYASGASRDRTRIHVIGADGSGDRQLTPEGGATHSETWPAWVGT